MQTTFSLGDALVEVPTEKSVNVASVKQYSPFRYPGGKTWFVPRFREWIAAQKKRPKVMVEPFVGGGIISLTAAAEKLVDEVVMVELDPQVAAVWQTITDGNADWLANKIITFEMTIENAQRVLDNTPADAREQAFKTIIKNRTVHGGILASGSGFLKHGEGGKGVLSRWYPQTLAKRIREIDLFKERITFIQGDAFEVMKEYQDRKTACFFIDPPYSCGGKKAGSRLYTHWELDHEKLFAACERLKGEFLLTYDNAEEVALLAQKHMFETKLVPMKNTHHAEMTELLISGDLSWVK
jgi:DNA adenine methylase